MTNKDFPELRIEDLSIGMRVRESQLSKIYRVNFVLQDSVYIQSTNDVEGTLIYFGDGKDEQFLQFANMNIPLTPIRFEEPHPEVVYIG